MSMGEGYLVGGILLAFPLAFLYRYLVLPHTSPHSKDVFLALTGLLLYCFSFGTGALHVVAMAGGSYMFVWVCGVRASTCCAVFACALAHLLYGYLTLSGVSYTVTWTLIHCQALLKVVGYFIDLYDEKKKVPESIVTYAAYIVFPFTCLVGPQFQYSRYRTFRQNNVIPNSLHHSMQRAGIGVLYLTIFYVIKQFTSTEFLLSEEFQAWYLPVKMLYITLWSKWLITKYCAIWCVAEAAAVITGIGGEGEGGEWDGIANVDVWKFETSLTIQDELSSFNVQTHQWVKRNVYKRCKVFKLPLLSRVFSLLFLYLWHGIYLGFLNLFLVEALGVSSEEALNKYVSRDKLARYLPRWLVVVLQYTLKNACVGYGLCGFALRSRGRCHVFYSSVYYCFHWGMLLWLVVEGVVSRRARKKQQ